ncbi:hypothetical protein GCM10023160_18370 [Brachybacterium paraconglomeratum]|uniref:hypothetical protein n=1 Tax=Brachybacterium paraconglomeratum TaxID=173362 RepID=UPI0031EAC1BA
MHAQSPTPLANDRVPDRPAPIHRLRRLGGLLATAALTGALLVGGSSPALADDPPPPADPAPAGVPSDDPRVLDLLAQDENLEYLGTPVTTQIPSQAAQGVVDGRHVSYQVFKGAPDTDYPATFAMTDIESGEQLDTCAVTGAEHVRNLNVATDGRVYWGTYYDSKFWRYDPATGECEDLGRISGGEVADHAFGLSPGPDGSMFLGVYPDSRLYLVDPETDEIELLREMDPGAEYIHAIAYYEETDTVYVGTGGVAPQIWMIEDGGRGEQTLIASEENAPGLNQGATTVGRMDIIEDRVIAQVGLRMIVLDLDGEVIHWDAEQTRFFFGHHIIAGAEPGTALFSTEGWGLVVYDLEENSFRTTDITLGGYLSDGVVDDSSGTPLLYGTSSLGVVVADLESETLLSDSPIDFAQPTLIQKLLLGPDDSVWASGYMVGLNDIDRTGADHGPTMQRGQYESATVRDGKMYLGAYGHAKFEELDPATFDPAEPGTVPRLFEGVNQGQDRPFGMAYNPERDEIYMGSVAIYGQTQGGLAIWEGSTGEHVVLTEEIGADENVVSVVHNESDGMVYIGTTVDGGLGSTPSGNTAGKLLVFDPDTRTVVERIDPAGEEQEGITGLMVDDEGAVWGVAEQSLFRYDPTTGVSTVEGSVGGAYSEGTTYWAYGNVHQSTADGRIYVTAGSRFSVHDPATGETTRLANGVGWSVVDGAGDVYLSAGAHLFRYPVEAAVTCDDTVTEDHSGPLTVTAGTTCIEDAAVEGPVTVAEGAGLQLTGAFVRGPVTAAGAEVISIQDSEIRGPVSLTGTTGSVEISGSTVSGPLTIDDTADGVTPILTASRVEGPLSCTGNAVAPDDDGVPNTVRGPATGDCAGM